MAPSRNIKHSAYMGPHTWEPCVPNSLTHRLDPCRHLVITEWLQSCGRNCLTSKEAGQYRVRDLDRVFRCPSCPILSHLRASIAEDAKAGTALDKAKDPSEPDSKLFKKTATTRSTGNLYQESFYKDRDMQMNEVQCKAVLQANTIT